MPEFEIVSLREAQFNTTPGRKGKYLHEYADYIQQLPQGQAGKLHPVEQEKHVTIRRPLAVAAKALGVPLTIKRSGVDIYFWREDRREEEPRRRPGRQSRRGRPGDLLLPKQ